MINKLLKTFCFVVLTSWLCVQAQSAGDYQLGSGDTIKISVFGQADLSIETLLDDSGKIEYPFLGQIQATGKTLTQLQQDILAGLKGDYLVNPNVSVTIVEYRPFFIDGEVKQPGGYPFQPGLTVSKAAALAGGFTERASLSKIFIVRSNDPEQASVSVTANALVQPGDIITVRQSYF
ncbi:polysaccharide biosynthesis/export family protein [Thalassotalea euphylliae]|uniref:Polysaccharide export protein n=1 Tax=Thalassotalea euphylliae TaxID=1655234 RepID=A0A3E0ULE1_9GAMM|nr:polysaccharide biosynthesis/export family protein [Thalassotalea euphylliae]REL36552.1 polysaccharide export protein [Thalassotalea euphylliae]